MKVRHEGRRVDQIVKTPTDPQWATALILGSVAVATLAITGLPEDVPVVVGTVLLALGINPTRQ